MLSMTDPRLAMSSPSAAPSLPSTSLVGRARSTNSSPSSRNRSTRWRPESAASGRPRFATRCAQGCGRDFEIVRIEVPERKDADAGVFLQQVVDRCNTISRAAATARRALRVAQPAIESALRAAGIPLNLDELGAKPTPLAARQILSLPRTLATQLDKPVVFFLDELQRAIDYTDGAELLEDLVDIYSAVSHVVVLVDGSDERMLERMRGAPIQFDKLCSRVVIKSPHPEGRLARDTA